MLYILQYSVVDGRKLNHETEWHIGEPCPDIRPGVRVITFQADGHELDMLLDAIKAASDEAPRIVNMPKEGSD